MFSRLTPIYLALLFLFAAPAAAQERPTGKPSATITIQEIQVAFVGSGAIGGGTLNFEGRSYPISVKRECPCSPGKPTWFPDPQKYS